jgi:hypothetical protein
MSQTSFTDSVTANTDECPHFFQGEAGPIVKILLYTDEPLKVKDDSIQPWSLGVMLRHLAAHAPAFASLCIRLVSRNSTPQNHADNRLDELIEEGDFDQIWFFGTHQGNRANFTMEVLQGGPQSELDDAEVTALTNWMRADEGAGRQGGGVLMTGDHAELRPPDALLTERDTNSAVSSPPAETFWGLGRGLGRRVPRAGQMRKWEGAPTNNTADSQNTQVLSFGSNFEAGFLQFDPVPQRLTLLTFDANGEPSSGGHPHPLFLYKQGSFIQVYPDHMHEGAVVIPTDFDDEEWPNSEVVKPQLVAQGIDNKKMKTVDLIAAYNGDRAGVGRIVADSTWHHYFNVNLRRFGPPGEANSSTDQIGQFYGNLALWLTPLRKRREMARAMIRWLATHPLLLEERRLDDLSNDEWNDVPASLGEQAYYLLSQVASPCEIHELLYALISSDINASIETLYLPERGIAFGSFQSDEFLLPSKELLLGSFINLYHREMAKAESSGGTQNKLQQAFVNVVKNGFKRAINIQNQYVLRVALASQNKNWFQLKKEKEKNDGTV